MAIEVLMRWEGAPLFWSDERGVLHVDAELYSRARAITPEAAEKELAEMLRELLPNADITVTIDG